MPRTASLFLCLAATAGAQNWPSFRGPNAAGFLDGQNLPANWDAAKSVNIRWKTRIPGLGLSSPIVWEDKVFVTTAISSDPKSPFGPGLWVFEPAADVSSHSWRVYCLDRNTGRILWERIAYQGAPKTKRHPSSSHANPTPATDGKHLAVFFGSEGLYTYDLNGKLLWKQDLGRISAGFLLDPDFEWGAGSSPILYQNLVILQCDQHKGSFLAAFDARDGKLAWRIARDELSSWSTPAVHRGKTRAELITNGRAVRGYDPLTGKELWRLTGNAEYAVATPVVNQELIFINDGFPDQPFYVIRAGATGDISLKDGALANDSVVWSKRRGGQWYLLTPLVYQDLLYTCTATGIVACYQAKTGERLYHQRLGKGGFTASPVAADGKLYFTSQEGDVYTVRAGPKYELLGVNPMGEVVMATPAISGGMIVVRTQNHVYGVGSGPRR